MIINAFAFAGAKITKQNIVKNASQKKRINGS